MEGDARDRSDERRSTGQNLSASAALFVGLYWLVGGMLVEGGAGGMSPRKRKPRPWRGGGNRCPLEPRCRRHGGGGFWGCRGFPPAREGALAPD